MFQATTAQWWAAAAGIGLLTTLVDLASSSLAPLAPHLLASIIGWIKTPQRMTTLALLLSVGILLPGFVHGDDWLFWMYRIVTVGCLAVITCWVVATRDGTTEHRDRDESGAVSQSVEVKHDKGEQKTPGRSDSGGSSDTEIDDNVNAALTRLRAENSFTDQQLERIELELRRLCDSEQVIELATLRPGTKVGRFIIEQQLSRGAEGSVFSGRDASTGESVAIKILRRGKLHDRFHREMEMVQRLAHPNIVTAYEVGEHQGLLFIAMELLKGPDLHVYVRRHGPLPWAESLRYVMQITQGLLHAHHRKLIHRDVKPGNVIMNGGDTVKLVDLGLAATTQLQRDLNADFRTTAGNLAGTVPFMAPEQARSLDLANVQSDIYGIGSTWFFLLTGEPRLPGRSLKIQLNNLLVSKRFNRLPDDCLPDPFLPIYRRTVAYEPQDRYANCDELLADLEHALADVGEAVPVATISVLVIEDSKTDMVFAIETLRRSNRSLKIHQAGSLAEGLEVCCEFCIDLVLLDLNLPDSSGIETVCRFRQAQPDVPLVILSGQTRAEVGKLCREAGANEFVSKADLTVHNMERIIFVTHSRARTYRPARRFN